MKGYSAIAVIMRPGRINPGTRTFPADRVAEEVGLPVGRHAQGAFEEPDVEVRLRAGRDLRRVVGPKAQIGLITATAESSAVMPKTTEEEATRLGHVDGEQGVSDDVALGASRAGVLRVLVVGDRA
jgi:hypothetical protein